MERSIKNAVRSILSFRGVLNVYHKGELANYNNIEEGYEIITHTSDFNTDKANLSRDFHHIKNDVAKSWKSKEELVY